MKSNRKNELKPRAYFSHSMQTYDTTKEGLIINYLEDEYRLLCPNHHIGRLIEFNRYLNIVEWADIVIAWEYEGFVTMGVYHEVTHALNHNILALVIREKDDEYFAYRIKKTLRNLQPDKPYHYGALVVDRKGSLINV